MASNITYTVQVNSSQANSNVNSLTTAFNNLNASVNKTSTSIDVLIAKIAHLNGVQSQLNTSLSVTNNIVIQNVSSQNNYNAALQNTTSSMSSLLAKAGGLYVGLRKVEDVLGGITSHGLDFEGWNAQFKAVYVTSGAVNNNFSYLLDLSQKSGQSINALTENYLKFSAAAKFSGESETNIKAIYTNFVDIATVMHWSSDKTRSALTAIEQMYNKNQVMSEELKKQLGNVLPAAVNIFARSLDVTTPKLMQMMKDGAVLPKETIKNFSDLAKQLLATKESLEDASHGFNAAMGRWDTAISVTSAALYEELKPAIIGTMEFATDVVAALGYAIKGLDEPVMRLNGNVISVKEAFISMDGAVKTWANNAVIAFQNAGDKAAAFWEVMTKPRSISENFDLLFNPSKLGAEYAAKTTTSYAYQPNTAVADSRKKASDLSAKRALDERYAKSLQDSLLSDKTAGDTEFTDKQIAKFIKKEGDVAKQLLSQVSDKASADLKLLSIEQARLESRFKSHQTSINDYIKERISLITREHEITLKKLSAEKEIITAEATRVQHYQDIQIDNDKDVVKLNTLRDRMLNWEGSIKGGYSVREGSKVSESTIEAKRKADVLAGKKVDATIPVVVTIKDHEDLTKEIKRLTDVVESKKNNLTSIDSYSSPASGKASPVKDIINAAAAKYGLDPAFMRMMAGVETGGTFDPKSYNKGSGASGLYQFIKSTGRAYGLNDSNKFDAATNADAGARFTRDNMASLQKRGIAINATNLYLAHQQGDAGLASIIKAMNGGSVSDELRRNMDSNGGRGKSPTEFYRMWERETAKRMAKEGGDVGLPTFNSRATMAQIDTTSKNIELQSQQKAKDAEIQRADLERQQKLEEVDRLRLELQDRFNQGLEQTHIEYLKVSGVSTTMLEFEIANKEKIKELQIEAMNATNSDYRVRVKAAIEELGAIKESVALKEKMNQLDKQSGIAGELYGMAKGSLKGTELANAISTSSMAQTQYDIMLPINSAKVDAINADKSLSWGEKSLAIAKLTDEMNKLKDETNSVANLFESKLSPIINTTLNGLINGTKSAKEVMMDFGKSTLQMLQNIIIEEMTAEATKGLTKMINKFFDIGGGGGGGAAGALSSMGGGFADGGVIGSGTGRSDSILASISNGSYVINSAAANNVGRSTLAKIANGEFIIPPAVAMSNVGYFNHINKHGSLPSFADGGMVGSDMRSSGTVTTNSPQFVVNVNHTGNESGQELGQKISLEMVKAIAKHEANKSSRIATKRR